MPLVHTLRRFEKLAAALAVASLALVAHAQSFGPAHVKPMLVAATRGAPPGGTLMVALVETIDPGWHTYWRDPGDAGEPTRIGWSLPSGWRAGDIVWPTPRRLPVGPLMNFGYVGQVVLPTSIAVPADARPGSVAHIAAKVSMLVCADVCVPQDADLAIDAPVTAGPAPADPLWGRAIAATIAAAPHPEGLAAAWRLEGDRLALSVVGSALAGRSVDYFYPASAGLIDAAKPETIEKGPRGVTVTAVAGQALVQAPSPKLVEGVLTTSDGGAFEVAAAQGPPLAGAGGAGARPAMGLALAALGAFLGGLILNLMPCVFPILSMKAAALIARPPGAAGSRRQGLAFLVGVMAAFLLLAGAIIALRAAGQSVGWGTQLQPAAVTAVLALILLAAALDLSGVFEVGASLQGLGGGLAGHADLLGAFFTGALAVVVAAPCTAPFMGPALGWALTQPAAVALIVFAALGLGFAAPFTALAFSPRLLRRLPRPGPWTDVLRKTLAFPLFGAAGWLLWVLAAQTDRGSLAAVMAAAVVLSFAAWVFGAAQRRAAAGGRARAALGLSALAAALALVLVFGAPFSAPPANAEADVSLARGVPSAPWSPERVAAARAAGRPVFVDFTAAWCVTCQVNERLALSTADAVRAFERTGAVYMRADWTNHDDAIAQALAEQGRVGVPLYLVYAAGEGPPRVLPQLLTSGLVAAALDAAAARARPGAGGIRPLAAAAR